MHGERGITAAEYRYKVVLESRYCFLGFVVSMQVRGHKLPGDILFFEELFYKLRAFVVKDLHVWFKASVG